MPCWAVMAQLFLAMGWLRAAVEKMIDSRWWTGDVVDGFLDAQRTQMLPFFRWFSDRVLVDATVPVSLVVVVTQFAIAGCLISNQRVRPALWCGIVLNLSFMLAGRVNPSVFYLLLQFVLIIGLASRPSKPTAMRRAVACSAAAALVLPFTRTLHPAHVHEDPALTLAFVGLLAAAGVLSHAAVRQLSPPIGVAVALAPDPRR